MGDEVGETWVRLGEMLIARRVKLAGNTNREAFVAAAGLTHSRNLSDIENARRTNYGRPMRAQLEQIYKWAPGSIASVLAGGQPVELNDEQPSETASVTADEPAFIERRVAARRIAERRADDVRATDLLEALLDSSAAVLTETRAVRKDLDVIKGELVELLHPADPNKHRDVKQSRSRARRS